MASEAGQLLSFSFGCAGWLQFYLFGVARAIQAYGLDVIGNTRTKMAGCSSGALTAAGLVLQGNFDEAVEHCKKHCLPECRASFAGLFRLTKYAGDCLDATTKLQNYKDCNGLLEVQVTKLPFFEGERLKTFYSSKDLRAGLLASCAAYPLASIINYRAFLYADGGLSDFIPAIDDRTIKISPFYFSRADIRPSRYVPVWWAFLPPRDDATIDWLYHLGYEDGKAWILGHAKQLNLRLPTTADPSEFAESLPLIARSKHPYDVPGRISLNRLIGYDLFPPTKAPLLYWLVDMMLAVWLYLLWKPVTIVLIYIELLLVLVNSLLYGIVMDFIIGLPLHALSFRTFRSSLVSWSNIHDCLTGGLNFKLPLKIIPIIGGLVSIQEAVHAKLFRQSLIYRLVWRML